MLVNISNVAFLIVFCCAEIARTVMFSFRQEKHAKFYLEDIRTSYSEDVHCCPANKHQHWLLPAAQKSLQTDKLTQVLNAEVLNTEGQKRLTHHGFTSFSAVCIALATVFRKLPIFSHLLFRGILTSITRL